MIKNNQRNLLYLAGVIIVVLAAAVLLSQRNTGGTSVATQLISPTDYQQKFVTAASVHLLLDVRTPEEFATGHIHGAVNIPVEDLANRLNEVPQDQPVVVYCRSGNRSSQAAKILANAGYSKGIYDLGGIKAWTDQGFALE